VQTDWNYTAVGISGLNWQTVDWRVEFLGIEWTFPLYQKLRALEAAELKRQAQMHKDSR